MFKSLSSRSVLIADSLCGSTTVRSDLTAAASQTLTTRLHCCPLSVSLSSLPLRHAFPPLVNYCPHHSSPLSHYCNTTTLYTSVCSSFSPHFSVSCSVWKALSPGLFNCSQWCHLVVAVFVTSWQRVKRTAPYCWQPAWLCNILPPRTTYTGWGL